MAPLTPAHPLGGYPGCRSEGRRISLSAYSHTISASAVRWGGAFFVPNRKGVHWGQGEGGLARAIPGAGVNYGQKMTAKDSRTSRR